MAAIIRKALILTVLATFPLFAATNPFTLPLKTIIIDAGHGGYDPGATRFFDGEFVVERELTLDIALRLEALLAQKEPELHVVLTRGDDTYLSLEERGRIAYQTILRPRSSALFLSIHVNSAEHSTAKGFEVLTKLAHKEVPIVDSTTPKEHIALFSKHSKKELNGLLVQANAHVASTFSSVLSKGLPEQINRGVKEKDLWVLNAARMPAVLVEVGFLSNDDEAALLLQDAYRQRLAQVLLSAIQALIT